MPSIAAHMIVAKEIGKRLNINSNDFIIGNILPDIIKEDDSHYKIQNKMYLVPNISKYLEESNLNNDLYLGYLVHLLLDKHFLVDYLSNLYYNKNIFLDGKIYKDYDYLNKDLVNKFNLDIASIEKILLNTNYNIVEEKLKYNIECLKQTSTGNTKYLSLPSFSNFLIEISNLIYEELILYANKYSKLSIYFRQ
jgi:hypothetical protein